MLGRVRAASQAAPLAAASSGSHDDRFSSSWDFDFLTDASLLQASNVLR
jgi:hypothetical protein